MQVIVIDSSIALQWVLPEEGRERAYRYVKVDGVISADVLMIEAGNVLAKKVRASEMSGSEAMDALTLIGRSVSRLVPTLPMIQRALDLSIALSHPIYDCVFLACAEQEKGRLVTRDATFAKRARERGYGHLLESAP